MNTQLEQDVAMAKSAERIAELEKKYNELIMAVSLKFPNETRHDTALRFIRERDMPPNDSVANQAKE
jgi:hypothetical protein